MKLPPILYLGMKTAAGIGIMVSAGLSVVLLAGPSAAKVTIPRAVEFRFTPTARAQIALWIEKPDGTFMGTVRLTQAVSVRGIGNRPGASQMNSGFRWPYGRRLGALPVWAHRRAAAPGAAQFRPVIFQHRTSEGCASNAGCGGADSSLESYFCLSFKPETTRQDALDAVSCASVFSSDKGRYLTEDDLANGYAEPIETADVGTMRPLESTSLYPPRRDGAGCGQAAACIDHPGCRDVFQSRAGGHAGHRRRHDGHSAPGSGAIGAFHRSRQLDRFRLCRVGGSQRRRGPQRRFQHRSLSNPAVTDGCLGQLGHRLWISVSWSTVGGFQRSVFAGGIGDIRDRYGDGLRRCQRVRTHRGTTASDGWQHHERSVQRDDDRQRRRSIAPDRAKATTDFR